MFGQGRPELARAGLRALTLFVRLGGCAGLLCYCAPGASAQELTLRLRATWGGGPAVAWQGRLSIERGVCHEPRLLGTAVDAHQAIWHDQGTVIIDSPSPRTQDGFELEVSGPPDAKLTFELGPPMDVGPGGKLVTTLGDLATAPARRPVDALGNVLEVSRAPGDTLRLVLDREHLVYDTGDTLRVDVVPVLSGLEPGARVRLHVELLRQNNTRPVATADFDRTLGEPGQPAEPVPVEMDLPHEEGVYELAISAQGRRLGLRHQLAERRLQLVVLAPTALARPSQDTTFTRQLEVDPAHPNLLQRVAHLAVLPGRRRGPLGVGDTRAWSHALGQLTQLTAPEGDDTRWEAYPLPIAEPGLPHVLEIDLPSDVPQTLGVCVVEPGVDGKLAPQQLEAGVHTPDEAAGSKPRWQVYRLVFWPRTKSPLVLLTNHRPGRPAAYGRLRVLSGPTRLPRLLPATAAAPSRSAWVVLTRPLVAENLGANLSLDKPSGRALDDWRTAYQVGTRLVDYLHYAGYSGLSLPAASQGGAIYPSQVWQPTTRLDQGAWFSTAQDPQIKDVLELLFRLCDREGLELAPAVVFDAPLPELEALRRTGSAACDGLEWIGPNGQTWSEEQRSAAAAPGYNVLHPAVQSAMLRAVAELAQRYGQHPSFAGVTMQLAAHGYAQLPGLAWGFDDATVARYEQAQGQSVAAGAGPERFRQRARMLLGEQRARWEDWRADEWLKFVRRLQAEVERYAPGRPLVLSLAESFDLPSIERELVPSLPRKSATEGALRRLGIDLERLAREPGLIVFRTQRLAPPQPWPAAASDALVNHSPVWDRLTAESATPAALNVQTAPPRALPSFDQRSPFPAQGTTWLVEPSPLGDWTRARFVHALATSDARLIGDGGPMLALTQPGALADWMAVYRRLPNARFQSVAGTSQPLVLRTCVQGNRLFVYWLNDSPQPGTLELSIDAPPGCTREALSAQRELPELDAGQVSTWRLAVRPFDLSGVVFSDARVRVSAAEVVMEGNLPSRLDARIKDLSLRAGQLVQASALESLANPGFEVAADGQEPPPGWSLLGSGGVQLRVVEGQAHQGKRAVQLTSTGAPAVLASEPFAPPTTGRLSVLVRLRVPEGGECPAVRLAIQGTLDGRADYYRFASLGSGARQGLSSDWEQYRFHVDDLPWSGLDQLQVRCELLGAGDLWVDDVNLSALYFSEAELRALQLDIFSAYDQLQKGNLSDCQATLEGYWPRFLLEHVAPSNDRVARAPGAPVAAPISEAPAPPARSGFLESMRRLVPRWYY